MSENSENVFSSPNSSQNLTMFFLGTPSKEEVTNNFLRMKRLADLNQLTVELSPNMESSPDLSESFETYLQAAMEKKREEKKKIFIVKSPNNKKQQQKFYSLNRLDDSDDSFLENEKMCEKTLHLNNESFPDGLVDLTTLFASPAVRRKSCKKIPCFGDETHLNDVEAPSFFNNSSFVSPGKNSPVIQMLANRPSTILEVSEASSSRTNMSSYRTAFTRTPTEVSEYYRTANEDSFSPDKEFEDEMFIKMPKIQPFYEMTKDSLDLTDKTQCADEMTKDSLNTKSFDGYSSNETLEGRIEDSANGDQMNDTLEQIEFMLAQAAKMQEEAERTPQLISFSPATPRFAAKLTPTVKSSQRLLPQVLAKSASTRSPLIKFSPAGKSPLARDVNSAFKRPMASASKLPLPPSSKKYQHIESPISRYIHHTPGAPLAKTAKALPGISKSPQRFNFRDSEAFANENESMNGASKGISSLPQLAKTKSSSKPQVFDQRDQRIKTPGGGKMHGLLAYSSPSVVVHQGHIHGPRPNQNQSLNETALSEQSFADLSLISGDVSVQVVEGVKRMK